MSSYSAHNDSILSLLIASAIIIAEYSFPIIVSIIFSNPWINSKFFDSLGFLIAGILLTEDIYFLFLNNEFITSFLPRSFSSVILLTGFNSIPGKLPVKVFLKAFPLSTSSLSFINNCSFFSLEPNTVTFRVTIPIYKSV